MQKIKKIKDFSIFSQPLFKIFKIMSAKLTKFREEWPDPIMNVPTNRTQLPFVAEKKRDYRFLTDGRLLVFIDSPPSNFETLQSCLRWISLPYPGLSPNTKQQGLSIVFLEKESPIQFDSDKIQSIRECLQEGKSSSIKEIGATTGMGFSGSTFRKVLHEMKYNYTKKSRVVHLEDEAKKKRLDHCLEIQKSIPRFDLSGIVFSDESYFKSNFESIYAWQPVGEKQERTEKQSDKFGYVMVFGAISKEGKSELYFKPQNEAINSETYQRVVE